MRSNDASDVREDSPRGEVTRRKGQARPNYGHARATVAHEETLPIYFDNHVFRQIKFYSDLNVRSAAVTLSSTSSLTTCSATSDASVLFLNTYT